MDSVHVRHEASGAARGTRVVLPHASESVRKNVERVFGQMKTRFLVLKTPFYESGRSAVDRIHRIFQTCAILHNMLLH